MENILMVLMMTQLIFIRNDAQIVDVTLKINIKVILGAISTCVSLLLGYYLSNYLEFSNIIGLIIGLMTGRMILSIAYPIIVRKSFNVKSDRIFLLVGRPLMVMAAIYVTAAYVGFRLNIESWTSLTLTASICFILVIFISFSLGLTKEQRQQVISRLGHLGIPGLLTSKIRL
jgi:hypothetical protein